MAPLKSLSISHLANQPAHPGKHSHLRFHQKFLAGTFESQQINQQKFRRMSWSMLTEKRCLKYYSDAEILNVKEKLNSTVYIKVIYLPLS